MKKVIILLLLVSCGKIKIDTKPIKVEKPGPLNVYVGPDFKAAAQFCDDRYGFKTEQSELCFMDFRNYLSLSVQADADLIQNYCDGRFTENTEIEQCLIDFEDYFSDLGE